MALGTTSTFTETRDEIIEDALANLGALAPGRSITDGRQLAHASRALGRIVKAIDAEGRFLWRSVRRTSTTTAADADFTPATDVLDVDSAMSYLPAGSTSRTPLYKMTRADYVAKSDRTTSGTPSSFMVERVVASTGQENLTVTLWPVPSATGDTIEYTAFLRALDYMTGATNSDFPTKWIAALVYGLTAELAPTYKQYDVAAQYRQLFEGEKAKQLNADNEGGDLVMVPFGGSY